MMVIMNMLVYDLEVGDKMLNKRGVSIIEIIVSLGLISIVLIFLINLFLQFRGTYIQSKTEADFGSISATYIKAIGDDIENYGLKSVEYKSGVNNHASVILTFDAYRPTKLSENIKKVLKVYELNGDYYISYTYDTSVMEDKSTTSAERLTNVVRVLPKTAVLNTDNFIAIEKTPVTSRLKAAKISLFLMNNDGNVYDINVSGLLSQ